MKNPRIFIGYESIAGVGNYLTESFRKFGYRCDFISYKPHAFSYDFSEKSLHFDRFIYPKQGRIQRLIGFVVVSFLLWVYFIKHLITYDVFIFIYGRSLLPLNLDLPILKLLGKKTGMIFVGSDIRGGEYIELVQRRPYSAYSIFKPDNIKLLLSTLHIRWIEQLTTARWAQTEYAGLLKNPYHMYWFPINVEKISFVKNRPQTFTITHSPSNPHFKGTKHITKAVKKLQKRYSIKFVLLKKAANQEVINALRTSHLHIDQIMVGSYGFNAVEAMAVGTPVVANTIYAYEAKATGKLPIIDANPDTLSDVLEKILKQTNTLKLLRKRSRSFVETYHDSDQIATAMLNSLGYKS